MARPGRPSLARPDVALSGLGGGAGQQRQRHAGVGRPGGGAGDRPRVPHYHPAGTCRLGDEGDASAVVDLDLRVRCVEGARVADASVLPVIPNVPLNATVLAVAEKAAALITKAPI